MAFGEVPRYIRGRFVRQYIDRHLQIQLPGINLHANILQFPKPVAVTDVHRDARGRKVPADVWYRQPHHVPHCKRHWKRCGEVGFSAWLEEYHRNWSAARKAAGLPHEVHERKAA